MLLEEKEAKGCFCFLSCEKRQELLEKGRWWASRVIRSQGPWVVRDCFLEESGVGR